MTDTVIKTIYKILFAAKIIVNDVRTFIYININKFTKYKV